MKCTRRGTDERIRLRLKAHFILMSHFSAVCQYPKDEASKMALAVVAEKPVGYLKQIIAKYGAK